MNEFEPPPPLPFSERVFDWLGNIVFPCQQDWERRRNAKIMTATVIIGLSIGWAVAKIIRHLYGVHH
jgi:hypothetical protein